jgi:hypothetical protein
MKRYKEEVEMRVIPVLMTCAVLASCTAGPPTPLVRAPDKQAEFAQLLAGKVPQRPITCLPHYAAYDMRAIDEATVAFRDGTRRTYVMHMNPGCNNLGTGNVALVTRQVSSPNMCSGDIVTTMDTLSRMTVGSCTIGDITPFVRP